MLLESLLKHFDLMAQAYGASPTARFIRDDVMNTVRAHFAAHPPRVIAALLPPEGK